MKMMSSTQICDGELELGEEVFFCMYPEHDPDILHESVFPHFAIRWDDQGNHRTYYMG